MWNHNQTWNELENVKISSINKPQKHRGSGVQGCYDIKGLWEIIGNLRLVVAGQ